MIPENAHRPLVSVVIPCHNHGQYLAEAIQSVLSQSYTHTEIIVVDDGSTDNTAEVCKNYPEVNYIYQKNQGLSMARNTGTVRACGEFLVYLDADDLLLTDGILTNVSYLEKDQDLAFVSGGHVKSYLQTGEIKNHQVSIERNHYVELLKGNYIGMHGAVMYRKSVAEAFPFDRSLKACEDYDLYLRIARKHPVRHHTDFISVYRFHKSNMSSNIPNMLFFALKVLSQQKRFLESVDEETAFDQGKKNWTNYYTRELYMQMVSEKSTLKPKELVFFLRFKPVYLFRHLKNSLVKR